MYGMTDDRHSPATHCVNRRTLDTGLFARETTELFKRQLGERAGADKFIGRRIGRLILICASCVAMTGKHGLTPAATDNGIVG